MSDNDIQERRAFMDEAREQCGNAAAAERLEAIEETAAAVLDAENISFNPATIAYRELLSALLQTDVTVVAEQVARLRGVCAPSPVGNPPLPSDCDNWTAMLAVWKEKRTPTAKTFDEATRSAERFQLLTGNIPVTQVTPDHVAHFKTNLAATKPGAKPISSSRKNTILALLRAVVYVAMKEGATTLTKNPFEGSQYDAHVVAQEVPRKDRESYVAAELQRLFNTRVFTDFTYRPAKGGGEAAFWLPLLGLYTGARLEDLGRLKVADVREFDGHPYLELGDRKRSGKAQRRSAYRKVPIHRLLVSIGFLDYVEARRREAGDDRGAMLFPALKADSYGTYTKMFSTWFNEYLDKHAGLTDARLDFHATRATFQYFAELSGLTAIEPNIIDYLVGHAPDMSQMRNHYGKKAGGAKAPPFPLLVEAMERYRIPGLDLSHLYQRLP